ncbi:uncharacterized protein LOC130902225 [Diorhabda carinulata]|uniref:uncharacterized protein LOC130902225 n=1 Tax=Diorhabda carinulata TaxID=1163345 RepID=UPI0025A05293|nr:uncharacterized protein LOC130902225 [Diorhabda carinulata]
MFFWYFLISLPLLLIYLMFLICLVIYKSIIIAILKMRYGTNLITVDSIDSFFTLGMFQDNFSYILTTMRTDVKEENLMEKLIEALDGTFIKNADQLKKLHGSLKNFMGFPFLLKKKLEAADFVTLIDVDRDGYESLNHLIHEYCTSSLHTNKKLLIDSTILKCSNEWKIKNNFKIDQIPLLFKVHHVVGDGLSIMNLIVQSFGDDKFVIDKIIEEFNNRQKPANAWKRLLEDIVSFFLLPGFMVCEIIKRSLNSKVFIGGVGSGEQYFAKTVGDDNMSVQKIKGLKNKIGDCRFTEILITAISASLCDYFRKKGVEIPKTVAAFIIVVLEMQSLIKNGVPNLTNQFKLLPVEIPIEIGSDSMLKRLNDTKKYTRSPDLPVMCMMQRLFINHIFGLFPRPIKKIFYRANYTSLSLSNIPGIHRITFLNGVELDEVHFFIINRKELGGIGFSIITYADKLHLAFKAQDNMISSQEDCQKIVDNVFNYINQLSLEICNKDI